MKVGLAHWHEPPGQHCPGSRSGSPLRCGWTLSSENCGDSPSVPPLCPPQRLKGISAVGGQGEGAFHSLQRAAERSQLLCPSSADRWMSPSPPFSSLSKAGCMVLPARRPVPACLLGVLLQGCSRRAGAVIPVSGCSAVSLCALSSGCISPLRQLRFGGEE